MTNHRAPYTADAGTILAGKYRVDRLLGQGGMGVVLGVRHLELQEDFAIKLMQGREFGHPVAVERFLREARAAVRLRSKTEHIVQVHDVGRIESGEPYIVMEVLVGQDLNDLLASRGVLSIADACTFVMQACHALHAAHQLGIIHRDLKPANLFLTRRPDGSSCIKVLDFGISKHTMNGDDSADIEITGTQDVMGSPLYMSPELAKGARNASPSSDIWALGAILYKLLTGRAPFQASSPAEVFASLLGSTPAPRPTSFRANIPQSLECVILRCLEKNTALRYDSVAALMRDLAPFTVMDEPGIEDKGVSTVLMHSARELGTPPAEPIVRRPSFADTLPVGFELQPPPTPPPIASPTAQWTIRQTLRLPGREPMLSDASRQTTDQPALRQANAIPEATGSTWGGTHSRLSAPGKLRVRIFLGLACTTFLVLMMKLVGIVIRPQNPNPASSSDSVESARAETPIVPASQHAREERVRDAIPAPSNATTKNSLPTPSEDKPMASNQPKPVVKPMTTSTAVNATNTNRPPTTKTTTKKTGHFEQW